ncbi:hypothetical protein [Paenibacillus crassostreae]|uniref:Uncharacterized protein n=1 Tax=Paenibacillus crassostreae TaxID=1763538 RepID=A0A167DQH6_9BACL|nr:hypothetical protein [Paenibacillus crassostreae]AOZ91180.1 hypothetical protein LPB68_02445 [Paenibacillus crassostreae]OAB74661.1 hypothetical protein PNBC_11515 [Paenibacillus crassostreae]
MGFQMGMQQKVIYQADNNFMENLKSIRHRIHNICRQHANQIVRIETLDGQVIVGRIVSCDRGLLYLAVPSHGVQRAFYGGPSYTSDEAILTLVLYELLVITLLYT